MAGAEKEEIPMLSYTRSQLSDENIDVEPPRLTSRTRSTASMSIPMYSMDSHESESHFVSHTGPLRSERRTPLTQMSGPLYSTRKSDNLWPMIALKGHPSAKVQALEYPSFNGTEKRGWPDDNSAGRNEHLLRSGQLGVCNDPYCTTCPTYVKFKASEQKKNQSRFESKVAF